MAEDNQFGFYRDVQLNNGALVVTGVTGGSGTSGTSGTSGAPGASGATGSNGSSGTSGAAGSAGSSGTSGTGGAGASVLGCTHFAYPVGTGLTYNLSLTSLYQETGTNADYANRILAYPFVPGRNINITGLNMDFYNRNANTDGRVKYLIYDNDDDKWLPKNLLVESTEITPASFTVVQYNVNYTFSAGTTYWLAIAFNSGVTTSFNFRGYQPQGMLTLGPPNQQDGYGIMYKMAVSNTISFPTIPSTWTKASAGGFYGSAIFAQGLWGGSNLMPEIRFKT